MPSHVLKNKLQAKLFHTAVRFVDYFTATTCHISDEWKENVGCPRCLPGRLTTIPYQPFTAVIVSNENHFETKATLQLSPSAFIASLRPLVVGEMKAVMLLDPPRPAARNNTVN